MPPDTVLYGFEATYHGPTDTLGSRVAVRSNGGKRRSFGFNHGAACAFKDAVAQYIAADRVHPADDRRLTHPPDPSGWMFRTVFETAKSYIIVAYWVQA